MGVLCEMTQVQHSLEMLREVGLAYPRLGQPGSELSFDKAQRIKLSIPLQRTARGNSLYVLDEPTTGSHRADVARPVAQLIPLVEARDTGAVVPEVSSKWA